MIVNQDVSGKINRNEMGGTEENLEILNIKRSYGVKKVEANAGIRFMCLHFNNILSN